MVTSHEGAPAAGPSENELLRALGKIQEPQLHTDIVSLGFLENVAVSPEGRVQVRLKLPCPAHPSLDLIQASCRERLSAVQGVTAVDVQAGWAVEARIGPRPKLLAQVKNLIVVAGPRKGVGVTTCAQNLAAALASFGAAVHTLAPEGEDLASGLERVQVGPQDYVFLDLPVGASEEDLAALARAPLAGAVVVTTPQPEVVEDAKALLKRFKAADVPVLGLLENRATAGPLPMGRARRSPTDDLSLRLGLAFFGRVPEDPAVAEVARGDVAPLHTPVLMVRSEAPASRALLGAARDLAGRMATRNVEDRTRWYQPVDIRYEGLAHLEILWRDGHRSVYDYRRLRENCTCARCRDEWTGRKLIQAGSIEADVHPLSATVVGRYAINIEWSDRHNSGIYTYGWLRELCECEECRS